MKFVSYDFEEYKVVFDYSGYDDEEKEELESHQIEIPDKDMFKVWHVSGVDCAEFTLVDSFDEKFEEILKREKEHFAYEELQEGDLFGVPGLRMEEDTEVLNGYEINKKYYYSIHDEDYFDGWTLMTFKRL